MSRRQPRHSVRIEDATDKPADQADSPATPVAVRARRPRARGRRHRVRRGRLFAIVGPFLWILTRRSASIAIYAGEFPFTPTLANFAEVLLGRRSDFAGNVGNSLLVAGASTALVLVVGTLAAYSLRRFRWPRWVVAGFLGWTLVFHMVPVLTLIGPWYIAFRELGLYDTRAALVLTHVTINLPMTVWLMKRSPLIPPEIEEPRGSTAAGRSTVSRIVCRCRAD